MKHWAFALTTAAVMSVWASPTYAQQQSPVMIDSTLEQQVIDWRRHIHANPELSNREYETAKMVANHLRELGLEVKTDIAHTGVVGLLKGRGDGPTVALRADMDALPVTEKTELPFKSTVKSTYRGKEVGVMHACGHDTHVAMLMGAAEKLASMRDELNGNVLFIFQPAEEGAPEGEEGGAELMLKQGLFSDVFPDYKPERVFGIHVWAGFPTGHIGYRKGPLMASSDKFEITVKGKQTHGSRPWAGVDPIVTSAQIINSAQTIISRQTDITKAPAVLSFGIVEGGVRNNIIPDDVTLIGTIRNFDMDIRSDIHNRLTHTAETIAEANGAEADVKIDLGYPVTVNNPDLVEEMLPITREIAGADNVKEVPLVTGAEDFSYYALEVPGMFVFLGVTPEGRDMASEPSNHSPYFYADEKALKTGVNLYVNWTLESL
ncbi:MAG: aminoacylase-2/carboxypeptidase-Z family hydrolase [Idiomarina sp. T82-3]|uniref:amidohydrolase n=2 Tax=Idiomarina TaxID=135575 RepID=UPI00079128A7|nr:amidohydrolase [Idiomarina sp. T82-3]KXS36400.1 MAG: aminoacylase-2/carboxypeptidase-Z family hydrolase [Idiomarina sp. T82-3]